MKRNSGSFRNSGAYTSPGTPEYNNMGETPKWWSSERVAMPTSSSNSRRHISAAALMPFNGGRALPSKWDDAERWITSPISGFNNSSFAQPQRRLKSKSGPLAPRGLGYLSNYSPPTMSMFEGGNVRNFMVNSPLTTGVLVPDGLSIHYDAGISGKSNSFLYSDNNMSRSTSVPGLSESLSSLPSSQDDKLDGSKEEESLVSRDVSRRDMATQMSPSGSTRTRSSSKGLLSFSNLPFSLPNSLRQQSNSGAKDEIRDVQVDKGTTRARRSSKKQRPKKLNDSENVEDLPSRWSVTEASKNTLRIQREEAKITAWENLQKAKADAAIGKLEMKLEKKRSASTDKILNKLRDTQMKSQAMRNTLSENHAQQEASRTSRRGFSSCCIYIKIRPLSNCFIFRKN